MCDGCYLTFRTLATIKYEEIFLLGSGIRAEALSNAIWKAELFGCGLAEHFVAGVVAAMTLAGGSCSTSDSLPLRLVAVLEVATVLKGHKGAVLPPTSISHQWLWILGSRTLGTEHKTSWTIFLGQGWLVCTSVSCPMPQSSLSHQWL